MKQTVQPFRVTVIRNGKRWTFDVRGTHDMLYRLCERIDNGTGRWGEQLGPLYYDGNMPRNGEPTQYDDRDAADYIGGEPVLVQA